MVASSHKESDGHGMKKTSRILWISLCVAVLLLVGVVYFLLRTTETIDKVAFKVGDRAVTEKTYNKYVEEGKRYGVSPSSVQQEVIQYEKNQIAAKKHSINIPQAYIELTRQDFLVNAALKYGHTETFRTAKDDFVKLLQYNTAFNNFVAQSSQGGTGIVVYEFPILPGTPGGEEAALKAARENAGSLRTKLVNGTVTVKQAVDLALAQTNSQPSQTSYKFIRASDGAVLDQSGGGLYARILDPKFILDFLKDKEVGITPVQDFEKSSAFFVDILYTQKQDASLVPTISDESKKIRVVKYV